MMFFVLGMLSQSYGLAENGVHQFASEIPTVSRLIVGYNDALTEECNLAISDITEKERHEFSWHGGSTIWFIAWDRCEKMRFQEISVDERKIMKANPDSEYDLSEIPKDAPLIKISNGVSSVLLFLDVHGRTKEILIGD
jgi:hypothetical protein